MTMVVEFLVFVLFLSIFDPKCWTGWKAMSLVIIREGCQEQKLPKSRHSWFGHFDISLEVTAQNEYSSTGAKVAYDCFWTYISFPKSQIKRKVISQWLPKWLKILLTIYFLIKVYRGPGYHALHDNTSFCSLWYSLKRKQGWFGHFDISLEIYRKCR